MEQQDYRLLEEKAWRLRRHVIEMTAAAGSGHPGGSLSAAEIVTLLYFKTMRHDAQRPGWPERDRFILCKGHAAPILYAALAEAGYFPTEELLTLRRLGSRLQGHPDMKVTPGVEASTGSLGQGLSLAAGLALGLRLDQSPARVFALLGDGEMQEGQVWEAAMLAAHYGLDNLVAFVDCNGLQIDGRVEEVMSHAPLREKLAAFNWAVFECDGHDLTALDRTLGEALAVRGRPAVILAKTIKGRGCSFMENQAGWHGKAPNAEQAAQALREIDCRREEK
ncbi:MAG: transketolase [Bacillota bacterium]